MRVKINFKSGKEINLIAVGRSDFQQWASETLKADYDIGQDTVLNIREIESIILLQGGLNYENKC